MPERLWPLLVAGAADGQPDRLWPPAASDADQPRLESTRILLAEDGPDNQRLIDHVLNKAGADVTIAENGKQAAEIAIAAMDKGCPFDVILTDMQMPVMDGYQATRLLRQRGYKGPIIALTAHAMDGDYDRCIQAGCNDYVSKPIDRRELAATIRASLEHLGDVATCSASANS